MLGIFWFLYVGDFLVSLPRFKLMKNVMGAFKSGCFLHEVALCRLLFEQI